MNCNYLVRPIVRVVLMATVLFLILFSSLSVRAQRLHLLEEPQTLIGQQVASPFFAELDNDDFEDSDSDFLGDGAE